MSDVITAPWRSVLRLVRNLDALVVLAIIVVAMAATFPNAARPTSGSKSDIQSSDLPGDGISVEAQVLDIWLPSPWIDAARQWAATSAADDQEGLQSLLESSQAPTPFYALSVRTRQVNGGVVTLTFLRGPYPESGDLYELLDVMNAAAGRPSRHTSLDYSGAEVHAVPVVGSRRELFEAIRSLSALPDRRASAQTGAAEAGW